MNRKELQDSLAPIKKRSKKPRDLYTHPYSELEIESRNLNSDVRSIHGCVAQLTNIARRHNMKLKTRILLPADMPVADIINALRVQYLEAVMESRKKLRVKLGVDTAPQKR